MSLVRLYGRLLGHGSLSVVMQGFRSALSKAELLAGVYGTDTDGIEALESIEGSNAPIGVYVGPLNLVGKLFEQGRHERHYVMVTPNSDQLPKDLVRTLKGYQEKHDVRFIAPSAWAADVVEGFLGSCISVPHGVSPEYVADQSASRALREMFEAGKFRVIHFSTSDRQRKGTVELIKAWGLLVYIWGQRGYIWGQPGAELMCVMDYPAKFALEEAIADGEIPNWSWVKESVHLMDRAELSHAAMARTLSRTHVVCQPSRGEGFGLIPLQALACGVPVVATTVTGHSEYLTRDVPGFIEILTGPLSPLDDLPGSLAPLVGEAEIAAALAMARVSWPVLETLAQGQAPEWQSNWSWEASLEAFVGLLK